MKVKQYYIVERYGDQVYELRSGPYNTYKEAAKKLVFGSYQDSDKISYLIMSHNIKLNHICP